MREVKHSWRIGRRHRRERRESGTNAAVAAGAVADRASLWARQAGTKCGFRLRGFMDELRNGGRCDDLSAYASGRYDNVSESGLLGASPGCTLSAHDNANCWGSSLLAVDAKGQDSTVTQNRQNSDTASDKISSIYCKC